MRKSFIILGIVMALLLAFAMPGMAIKIAPYSQPLHDIMHWDAASQKLIINNPEGESQTVSWLSTVDLWNYNGNSWTYDLPDGDKFAFSKRVDFNIATTEGAGSTVRGISLTDTVGAALAIHEGIYSHVTSAYMTGSWTNAVVGVITYSATGSAGGGMAASFCGELNMQPAASSGGSYYPYHSYFNFPTSTVLIDSTAFNYAFEKYEAAGGAVVQFDLYGDFWHIVGLTPADGYILSEGYTTLRCLVDVYDKYLVLSRIENGLGMGSISPNQLNLDAASPLFQLYTTSAVTAASGVQSALIQQTMTVASNVNYPDVLKVQLISDVKTGAWCSAIFAQLDYVESGLAHGQGSVIATELSMPSVTAVIRGEYSLFQMDIDMPTGCVMNNNPISLFKANVWGGAETEFDDVGVVLDVDGVTAGANDFFYLADLTVTKADGLLKIRVNDVFYYVFITTAINGGD